MPHFSLFSKPPLLRITAFHWTKLDLGVAPTTHQDPKTMPGLPHLRDLEIQVCSQYPLCHTQQCFESRERKIRLGQFDEID